MKGKRIIHPVDIQDRDGFLRFLNEQAREGWEAVNVGLNATWFRQTDHPPRGYTMWINPNGGELRDPAKRAMWESREDVEAENAKILEHSGPIPEDWKKVGSPHYSLVIYAMPEPGPTVESDWEWDALDNYALFNPGGIDIFRGIKGLIMPVAALAMLVTSGMSLDIHGYLLPLLLLVSILLIALLAFGTEILSERILSQHRSGLVEARRMRRHYTTPEEVARKVPLKNKLEFWAKRLKIAEIGLLVLMLLIWF